PPEITVPGADGKLFAFRLFRILNFCNTRADGVGVDLIRRYLSPVNGVVSVKNDGGEFLLPQAEKHGEVVAVMGSSVRSGHIRLVEFSAPVIVLDDRQRLGEGCAGDKDDTDPVVDDAVGNIGAHAGSFGFQLFHQDFTLLETFIGVALLVRVERVYIKEGASG